MEVAAIWSLPGKALGRPFVEDGAEDSNGRGSTAPLALYPRA